VEVYGNRAEYEAARTNDPIPRFRSQLIGDAVLTEGDAARIEEAVRAAMDAAVQFALASPFPAPEEALNYVLA
jgi:pyruvate dehydrogenase E1 component alpha subunit